MYEYSYATYAIIQLKRALKSIKAAVCGIQCVDLVLDITKILGTHFFYDVKLKGEMNFCLIIANNERVFI